VYRADTAHRKAEVSLYVKEPVLGPVVSARCPCRVTPLTFCTGFDGLEKQVWLIKSENSKV
jgi:hypothetical protein